jgi:hypothetical protein
MEKKTIPQRNDGKDVESKKTKREDGGTNSERKRQRRKKRIEWEDTLSNWAQVKDLISVKNAERLKRVDAYLVSNLFRDEPFKTKKIIVNDSTMANGLGLAYKWEHNQWLKFSLCKIMSVVSLEMKKTNDEPQWIKDILFNPSGEIVLFREDDRNNAEEVGKRDSRIESIKEEDFFRWVVWVEPAEPLVG